MISILTAASLGLPHPSPVGRPITTAPESIPVDKEPGDSAYAGTLCTSGALEIFTDRVGQETTLGNMIRLVQEARSTQAPIQRVASDIRGNVMRQIAAMTGLRVKEINIEVVDLYFEEEVTEKEPPKGRDLQ